MDLADEAKAARMASAALIVGAACYVVLDVLGVFVFSAYAEVFREMFAEISSGRRYVRAPQPPDYVVYLNAAVNLIDLVLLIVAVMFLIWFYKAAQVAERSGLPARRSPAWAIAGFIIPIVNFWFPYQSAVDMFPAGHPGRSLVKRWWALWISMGVIALIAFTCALFSTVAGVVVALIAGAVAILAALAARAVIAEIGRVHADLIHTQVP